MTENLSGKPDYDEHGWKMELNKFLIHTKLLQFNCTTRQYNLKNRVVNIMQRFISISPIYSNNCYDSNS